jgi:hypothetical protein
MSAQVNEKAEYNEYPQEKTLQHEAVDVKENMEEEEEEYVYESQQFTW